MKLSKTMRGQMQKIGAPQATLIMARAIYREAERIMADSRENYVPVDLATLKDSGHVKLPEIRGTVVVVTMGYGGAAAGYALFVHEGTGPAVGQPPFMPPVDAIAAWARRHGIPEEAAYPIARAIGQRGLAPSKYLERPANAARRGMDKRLAADVNRELAKLGRRGGVT